MKFRSITRNNYALSSHTLDTVLLLGVAVVGFAVVSANFFPIYLPSSPPNVELSAYIRGDYVFIEHMGGESLDFNQTDIIVSIGGVQQQKPPLVERNSNNLWECGEYVSFYYNTTDIVSILVVDKKTNSILLQGNLKRGEVSWIGSIPPILVSSLRTNSDDEDLICYSLPQQNFNAKTYIYNWKKNGNSIFEVLLPFDSQSSSFTKDYSGNNYNGVVNGATWISDGKVGGAYSFDGINDSITLQLPEIFNNWNNNFTISFWIYSRDIETDTSGRCISEIYIDDENSLQMFQVNSSINFGFKIDGKIEHSLRTVPLKNNTWYFITLVYSSDNPEVYVNGTECPFISGERDYQSGDTTSLTIGERSDGNNSFYGYIDEFYIYRYARSSQQIYQDYLDTKDGLSDHRVLVASETSIGDAWSCTLTPNNSIEDGDPINSEVIVITSYGGGT